MELPSGDHQDSNKVEETAGNGGPDFDSMAAIMLGNMHRNIGGLDQYDERRTEHREFEAVAPDVDLTPAPEKSHAEKLFG